MSQPINRLRVVLVDDHTLFREGLAELLGAESDLEVVGQAGDSIAAVGEAASKQPHVVLLDVEMPYDPVPVTMRRIQEVSPSARIVILTMHDEPFLVQQVLMTGAYGLLVKTATGAELIGAIRAVGYQGKTVLSVSHKSATELAAPTPPPLSRRELEVLEQLGSALSNAQIATNLFITEGTVKRHLTNIFAKLGAVSRLDAVKKAYALHLISSLDTPNPPAGSGRM
jgi:DNA-binding NarL/FixJ family response regulator